MIKEIVKKLFGRKQSKNQRLGGYSPILEIMDDGTDKHLNERLRLFNMGRKKDEPHAIGFHKNGNAYDENGDTIVINSDGERYTIPF